MGEREREVPEKSWRADWEDREALTLERSLATSPARRLAWPEAVVEVTWTAAALPGEERQEHAG